MKFLVDQNLPRSLCARLADAGHDAKHTAELGLERAADEDIFEWCRDNAMLVTADKRLTKFLAAQHASSPSVVVKRGYLLDVARLEADLLANFGAIEHTIGTDGHAVFSMAPDRPTRAQLLPLISDTG